MNPSDVHKDHRKRMRDRFKQNGISSFSDHEIMEMLLYPMIPRRDTNPIAHELLSEFGDMQSVLSAEKEELCNIDGIGEAAADQIVFLGEVFSDITMKLFDNVPLDSEDKIGIFAFLQMGIAQAESAVMVYLDGNNIPISSEWLYRGKSQMTDYLSVYIRDEAKRMGAASGILIHNHKREPLEPSAEDQVITMKLRENLSKIGVKKLWHVITSEKGYIFI